MSALIALGDAAHDTSVDMGVELEALILSDQGEMEDQWIHYRESLAFLSSSSSSQCPFSPPLGDFMFLLGLRLVVVSGGLFWAFACKKERYRLQMEGGLRGKEEGG